MSSAVQYSTQGDVAILTISFGAVNALGLPVREGLWAGIEKAEADAAVKAVVITGAGRTFPAGADISEFKTGTVYKKFLPAVCQKIEDCKKPVIAAIHGTALGGGCEIALSCHYRIAVSSAKCGLPEVHLGILPGAGGTQRLPRLIGPFVALELIISGAQVNSARAEDIGLLDRVVSSAQVKKGSPAERALLLDAATFFAREVKDRSLEGRRVSQLSCQTLEPFFYEQLLGMVAKPMRGHIAPKAICKAVAAAATQPFEQGMKTEQKLFMELAVSPQAKALQHFFNAERATQKIRGVDMRETVPIQKVGIIGAGTMGGGIAMNFIQRGIDVIILEIKQEYLDNGLKMIQRNYMGAVKKGRKTKAQVKAILGRLKGTLSYNDLADCDMVIEAVFEDMNIKKQVLQKLDAVTKPSCILGTNTSTLSVDTIAAFTKRPDRVIGLHFFSPANVMKLLEIVRGSKTSDKTIATSMRVAKRIGKVGVLVGNCWGFVGNRMLEPYGRESAYLIEEGALPQQVDKAIFGFGMAMGPFAMGDMAGNDIGFKVRKSLGLTDSKTRPQNERYHGFLGDKLVNELARNGLKSGKGWYQYKKRSRKPVPDPVVNQMIVDESAKLGFTRRHISNDEIVERSIYPLINEGLKILEEGIADKPSDIDIVWIYGYGFPRHLGGPMHYADHVGLRKIRDRLAHYHQQHPTISGFKPCALLNTCADQNISLAKYWKNTHKAAQSKL